jgi:hypothetical protein
VKLRQRVSELARKDVGTLEGVLRVIGTFSWTGMFNWLGLLEAAAGFAAGWAVCDMVGSESNGLIGVIGGPLTAMMDLVHRVEKRRSLWRGSGGGRLFFLPVWMLGAFWLGAGVVQLVR